MNNLIYTDAEGTIRTYSNINPNDFDVFYKTLVPESILYINGMIYGEHVSEKDREIFPIVLKSFMKQWSTNQQVLQPVQPKVMFTVDESKTDIRDDGLGEMPVKKKRKPKGKNNAN